MSINLGRVLTGSMRYYEKLIARTVDWVMFRCSLLQNGVTIVRPYTKVLNNKNKALSTRFAITLSPVASYTKLLPTPSFMSSTPHMLHLLCRTWLGFSAHITNNQLHTCTKSRKYEHQHACWYLNNTWYIAILSKYPVVAMFAPYVTSASIQLVGEKKRQKLIDKLKEIRKEGRIVA